MKKIKSIILLVTICASFAFASSNNFSPEDSNVWVGAAYAFADSPEQSAIIGVAGVLDTALMEALAVSIWGGPVGIGVGIAVGL